MGKPPSIIVVVRHGARLDAADKQWHLTSPTPYDPPLTYGGWNQSRALGMRIGSLLHHRELHGCLPPSLSSDGPPDAGHSSRQNQPLERVQERETRKHRIIIHSSPFLRCVQTAISLSAGISQSKRVSTNTSPHQRHQSGTPPPTNHRRWRSTSPRSQHQGSPQLTPIREPQEDVDEDRRGKAGEAPVADDKQCLLRLDPCLGEWLTPDYFEQITPPPGSVMMLAGAKANLLRQEDSVHSGSAARSARGHFPGGWNGFSSGGGTSIMPSDENAPPARTAGAEDKTDLHGAVADKAANLQGLPKLSTSSQSHNDIEYIPPTPTYAISPSDPIPAGYVTHARDACVDVDFQWDSMRAPLDWGSGGEYGEEWSSMHRRFRTGLEKMVNWYKTGDYRKTKRRLSHREESQIISDGAPGTDEDDDTDTVLIIVTHGAGCNAIIGALTNRPALLDVGMASLTLAVRKDSAVAADDDPAASLTPTSRKPNSNEMSEEYHVKLVNSTEHLRVGSSSSAQSPSPRVIPSSMSSYRHRFTSLSVVSDSPESSFSIGPAARSSSFNGTSRGLHNPARSFSGDRHAVPGLWGSTPAAGSAEDIIPKFEDSIDTPKATEDSSGLANASNKAPDGAHPQRTRSQHGLWSSRNREPASKRRWTVTERGI
ncbi:phosphoglycerate mutase [Arthroderma uncinatum]|uniref:phosphoglycerate mutase n=1 Tax=Arthroderma uncinatum TaxID=74035 RepID=UPI00144AAFAB|nr:phosphoglycerate mutase [Arthroderma uncinatum]KAF3482622.1 phosphoglycerate mutase [Arthroderma uncinatum]